MLETAGRQAAGQLAEVGWAGTGWGTEGLEVVHATSATRPSSAECRAQTGSLV